MVFLKECLVNVSFEKNQQVTKNHVKFCKEYPLKWYHLKCIWKCCLLKSSAAYICQHYNLLTYLCKGRGKQCGPMRPSRGTCSPVPQKSKICFLMFPVPQYCHCSPQNLAFVPLKKNLSPCFSKPLAGPHPYLIATLAYRSSLIWVCTVDQKASRSFQLGTKADDLCHDWSFNS